MGLKEKIDNLWVSITGNRLLLTTPIMITTPFYLAPNPQTTPTPIYLATSLVLTAIAGIGGGILGATMTGYLQGKGTPHMYKKTKRHIQRFGKLKPRYVKREIKKSEDGRFIGYCQNQGVYLAAKKYGQTRVFQEEKKKHSRNIIPNF